MSTKLPSTKSPNLHQPAEQYDQAQQVFLTNQLRLYFAQVDANSQALTKYYNNSNAIGANSYTTIPYTVFYATSGWTPIVTGAINRYQMSFSGSLTINAPTDIGDNDTIYIRLIGTSAGSKFSISNISVPNSGTTIVFPYSLSTNLEYHLIIQYSSLRSQWQLVQLVGGY